MPKYRAKPDKRSGVTLANLTTEEFEYLTSDENQQAWAHLPLMARSIMFHRKFPDRWLSWQLLAKIYAKAGIKKKAVVIKKVPQKKT